MEESYPVKVPRNYEIEFYGLWRSGDIIDVETAIHRMYLGKGLFYPIIDVAVMKANPSVTTVSVMVSGLKPVTSFEQTWNQPPGAGPFKQMLSLQFEFESE